MSTRRGYLETQGDRKRLRIVKEGFDADDETTPVNAVLFDSDSEGMGSVLETGEVNLPNVSGTSGWSGSAGYWVRSWDYDFVPLCIFQYDRFNAFVDMGMHDTVPVTTTVGSGFMSAPIIRVSKSGIWFRGSIVKGWLTVPVKLKWTAFRISAT